MNYLTRNEFLDNWIVSLALFVWFFFSEGAFISLSALSLIGDSVALSFMLSSSFCFVQSHDRNEHLKNEDEERRKEMDRYYIIYNYHLKCRTSKVSRSHCVASVSMSSLLLLLLSLDRKFPNSCLPFFR